MKKTLLLVGIVIVSMMVSLFIGHDTEVSGGTVNITTKLPEIADTFLTSGSDEKKGNQPYVGVGEGGDYEYNSLTEYNMTSLIRIGPHLSNDTTFYEVHLELYFFSMVAWGPNESHNVSIYEVDDHWIEMGANWTNRTDNFPWQTEGGNNKSGKIDSIEFINGTEGRWIQFNITKAYKNWMNNGTENLGLILMKDEYHEYGPVSSWFYSSEYTDDTELRPRLNITYSSDSFIHSGESTIKADKWNLKGYSGEAKNASTLFSEITNCTAIVGKNITTGYYYTYMPSVGLEEDWDIQFGDGLFIMTSTDETWNHC